jgi:PST family polysaccharide transporter
VTDSLTPPPSGLTERVLRGAGFSFAGYLLSQAITFGFYLALARLATPEDFGEFTAGSIVVSAGILFAEGGMLAALIHRRERLDAAASTAVVASALAGVAGTVIALALSPLVGAFFESERVGAIAAVMAGILFVRSLQIVPEALMQRRFSMLRRVAVEPAQAIAFGVAAVIATSNGMGPWGLVIGFYAAATVDVLMSWSLVGWRPRIGLVSFSIWREMIAYGRHVIASVAVNRLGDQVPKLILGRFVGENALGQYRYGDRMAIAPVALVFSAASSVLFPAFARISHDSPRFREAFLRSLRWFAALSLPLGLVLIPLGEPLAVVAFGEVWRDAGYAAMALSGFTVGAALAGIAGEGLKAAGEPQGLTRIQLVTALCSVVAMVALIPLGLVGVVAGVSLGTLIGAGYGLVSVSRVLHTGAGALAARIWPATAAALMMAAAVTALEQLLIDAASHGTAVAVLLLAAEGLLAIALYGGLLVALAPDTPGELRTLRETMRERGQDA